MEEIKIYQVYADFSDFSGQHYEEHGYFKNLDNAIKKFKEIVNDDGNKNVEVDLDELEKNNYYTINSVGGLDGIYGICIVQFED